MTRELDIGVPCLQGRREQPGAVTRRPAFSIEVENGAKQVGVSAAGEDVSSFFCRVGIQDCRLKGCGFKEMFKNFKKHIAEEKGLEKAELYIVCISMHLF